VTDTKRRPNGGTHQADRWDGAYQFSQPSGSQLALREFGVRSLDAQQVNAEKVAVGRVRGGTVTLDQSASAVTLAKDARLDRSAAVLLTGAKVSAERVGVQWLIGGLVQAKQVFAITVIAGKVEGQVKCLFDARGAFAFGVGLALMSGLLRALRR
jgi:hypothetical protein